MKTQKISKLNHIRAILEILTSYEGPHTTADNFHPQALNALVEDGFVKIMENKEVAFTTAGLRIPCLNPLGFDKPIANAK